MMFDRKSADAAASQQLAGEEMSDEQLSHVVGAAQLLASPQRSTFATINARAAQAIQVFRQRLPVVNPQRALPGLGGFIFDDIPPDLENPWPKGPPEPPPEDPPIPPDLENPWPSPPPPADFPLPFGR